jgi:hypothetical protein
MSGYVRVGHVMSVYEGYFLVISDFVRLCLVKSGQVIQVMLG